MGHAKAQDEAAWLVGRKLRSVWQQHSQEQGDKKADETMAITCRCIAWEIRAGTSYAWPSPGYLLQVYKSKEGWYWQVVKLEHRDEDWPRRMQLQVASGVSSTRKGGRGCAEYCYKDDVA
jgi:hypothetical protein